MIINRDNLYQKKSNYCEAIFFCNDSGKDIDCNDCVLTYQRINLTLNYFHHEICCMLQCLFIIHRVF